MKLCRMHHFLSTIGLIIVVVGIVTILFSMGSNEPVSESEHTGKYAERISAVYDNKLDPCQDFNLYACTKRDSDTGDANASFIRSSFIESKDNLLRAIKSLIEEPQLNNESRSVMMAKQLYNNCMYNTSFSSFYSNFSWLPFLNNETAVSQWPITEEQWNQSEHRLEIFLAQIFGSYRQNIFRYEVNSNTVNADGETYELTIYGNIDGPNYNLGPEEMIFNLNKPSPLQSVPLGSARKGDFKKVRSHSHNLFESDALEDRNQGNSAAVTNEELKSIKKFRNEFETLLEARKCGIHLHNIGSGKNNNYTKFTLEHIQTTIPQINWTVLAQQIFDAAGLKEQIPSDKTVYFPCFEFFQGLGNLIEETGRRTASNSLLFHFASEYLQYLDKDLFESFSDSFDELRAKEDALRPTRWMNCARIVKDGLQLVVVYLYQQRHPKLSAENTVKEIFDYLKKAFRQVISNQAWIPAKGTDQFKNVLLEKLMQMKAVVQFPKELIKSKEMDQVYGELSLNESLLSNVLKMLSYRPSPAAVANITIEPFGSLDVGAFYDAFDNKIDVPVGLLLYPVYNEDYPMYLKFAQLGFVLAHELAHGFDNSSLLLDNFGKDNITWWPEDALIGFRNQAVCFVDQYGKFKIPLMDQFVDGNRTLDENICDNVALPLSWMAYEMWAKDHNTEPPLPGLNLTIPQIFHIGLGQMWCESPSKERSRKYIAGTHSPFPIRVLGVLQNSANFGNIFDCPAGSPMNPVQKCSLWS